MNLRMRCKAHGDMKSKLQRTDNVESSINTGDLSDHHKEQKKKRHLCHAGKNTIPLSIGATIYAAVQQRAQGVMGGRQNTECSALFPCAPNGSKTRTPGSETYAKKSPVSSSQ